MYFLLSFHRLYLAHIAVPCLVLPCTVVSCPALTLSFSGLPGTLHPDESPPAQMDSPDSSDWRDLLDLSGEIASTAIGAAPMDAGDSDSDDNDNGGGENAAGHGGLGTAEGSTIAKSANTPGQRSDPAEPQAARTTPLLGGSGVWGREGGCAAAIAAVGTAAGAAAPSGGGIADTEGRFAGASWVEGTAASLREASVHRCIYRCRVSIVLALFGVNIGLFRGLAECLRLGSTRDGHSVTGVYRASA